MKEKTAYLYLNGLGDGSISLKDRVVQWWWQKAGLELHHAGINWYEHSLNELEQQVLNRVENLLRDFGKVAIIGGSAGGSLALNVFSQIPGKKVGVITAHARLAVGNYSLNHPMSLKNRAGIDTNHASEAFVDSVRKVESEVIPNLSEDEKRRIFNLTQLTDLVVDPQLMQLDGVQNHRSIAFGHSGGFLAHLLVDRDLIATYMNERLIK